jgi:endonuclease YncB( thermonuclease family)
MSGLRKTIVLLASLGMMPNVGVARQTNFEGPYLGEVTRVIDGDTFEAEVAIWPRITSTISVRLRGFDAPELFRPACEKERYEATLAKQSMMSILPVGQVIVLENVEADSFFGRVIADVSRVANVNKYDLSVLLKNREAMRPWVPSEEPIDWCAHSDAGK